MSEVKPRMEITLQPYQEGFLYSKARHPAMVGGWGVGKTTCAILRSLIYSRLIPDNLGVIFRKTAKSLFDSTLRDFEKYTGYKADSQRNVIIPTADPKRPSTIMFRHIDEIGDVNQQNINLGWFYIEQAEELESDKEFFMLWGRLRRAVEPSAEFVSTGCQARSGWVIANAGDNWVKQLWKDGKLEGGHLTEACTWDNAKNLPQDFLDSLKQLEKVKPEMYKRFVLNDWSVNDDQYTIIRREEIEHLKGVVHDPLLTKKLIACDPSLGGDACVVMVFENTKVIFKKSLKLDDTMKIVGELMLLGNQYGTNNYAIDSIGIGKGIADRLAELGKNVIAIQSAESATDKEKYANKRSELWGYCAEQIRMREIEQIEDEDIIKQMLAVRYDPKAVNSKGHIKLVPKQETKKVLGRSPDDADCFVYGIWGLKEIEGDMEDTRGTFPFERKKRTFSGAGGW